jgi:hypothetical protein
MKEALIWAAWSCGVHEIDDYNDKLSHDYITSFPANKNELSSMTILHAR